jgi:hypothetical protein
MSPFGRRDVSREGRWELDGTGVHEGRVFSGDFDVAFRNDGIPNARIFVTVAACDLDDGGLGVQVIPTWTIFADPAHTQPGDPAAFSTWAEPDPLPQVYGTLREAGEAARRVAEALAAGDRSALDDLDQDVTALIFGWDGQAW